MPSDLLATQNKATLVQKGFYDKEALELSEKYPHPPRPDSYILRPLDPRLLGNEHMLGQPNATVQVNQGLMAEIQYAQHLREYERGSRPDAPINPNAPKPIYSTQGHLGNVMPTMSVHDDNGQHLIPSTLEHPTTHSYDNRNMSNLKDKSVSRAGDGTNRTTVPSQLPGYNNAHD